MDFGKPGRWFAIAGAVAGASVVIVGVAVVATVGGSSASRVGPVVRAQATGSVTPGAVTSGAVPLGEMQKSLDDLIAACMPASERPSTLPGGTGSHSCPDLSSVLGLEGLDTKITTVRGAYAELVAKHVCTARAKKPTRALSAVGPLTCLDDHHAKITVRSGHTGSSPNSVMGPGWVVDADRAQSADRVLKVLGGIPIGMARCP